LLSYNGLSLFGWGNRPQLLEDFVSHSTRFHITCHF
jgi:hypothetical protein